MSESGTPPTTPTSGRQFGMGSRTEQGAPPGVVNATPPTQFQGVPGANGSRSGDDLFTNRFAHTGVTPIPFMVVALACMAAAGWATTWAEWSRDAPDALRTSEWWTNVTVVLIPSEDHGLGAYTTGRMWVALGLLALATLAIAIWIGRIGTNVKPGNGPFGAMLPLLAFPAWWALPTTINLTASGVPSRSDLLVRWLVALGIFVAQFLLLRWPLLNRIWRAGNLPYDAASIVLWLPMFVPWLMIQLSTLYTLLVIGDDGRFSDSGWVPTDTMYDWAQWTTRLCAVGTLALLVVVTIVQHVGLRQDRLDHEASKLR
jgi:hypothetical protein